MKRWNVILGVDVSKLTFDVSSAFRGIHLQINNNRQGFAVFMKWCKNHRLDLQSTLVVMEHTGGYEHQFCQFCESINVDYLRVSGLEIKNSMGIVRGKTDKDDSYRISKYGEQRMDELIPSPRLNQYILDIKQLLSFRKRLVRENAGLKASVKERKRMYQEYDRSACPYRRGEIFGLLTSFKDFSVPLHSSRNDGYARGVISTEAYRSFIGSGTPAHTGGEKSLNAGFVRFLNDLASLSLRVLGSTAFCSKSFSLSLVSPKKISRLGCTPLEMMDQREDGVIIETWGQMKDLPRQYRQFLFKKINGSAPGKFCCGFVIPGG